MQKSISKKERELLKIQRSRERQELRIEQAVEQVESLEFQQTEVLQKKHELENWQETLDWFSQRTRSWQEQQGPLRDTLKQLQ